MTGKIIPVPKIGHDMPYPLFILVCPDCGFAGEYFTRSGLTIDMNGFFEEYDTTGACVRCWCCDNRTEYGYVGAITAAWNEWAGNTRTIKEYRS